MIDQNKDIITYISRRKTRIRILLPIFLNIRSELGYFYLYFYILDQNKSVAFLQLRRAELCSERGLCTICSEC